MNTVISTLMKWATHVSLGTLVAVGLTVGLAQTASAQTAQTANVNPLQEFQNPDVSDPFSSRGSNQMGGVLNLIQRAMQNNPQNVEEFNDEQQANLDEAAAAFRAQQRQRLGNQPTAIDPAKPASAPSN